MKKVFLCICTLSLLLQTTAQEQPVVKDRQYYLTKSNNQKTTAWIILGAGVGMMVSGYAVAQNTTSDWSDFEGVFVFLAGVPVSLASIPFFVSSGNNKAKAAAMAGPGIQPIHLGGSLTRLAPGITIKIQF